MWLMVSCLAHGYLSGNAVEDYDVDSGGDFYRSGADSRCIDGGAVGLVDGDRTIIVADQDSTFG